jgi:hypothetical protein
MTHCKCCLLHLVLYVVCDWKKKVSATENATGTSNLKLKTLLLPSHCTARASRTKSQQCLLLYTALTGWSLYWHAVCSMWGRNFWIGLLGISPSIFNESGWTSILSITYHVAHKYQHSKTHTSFLLVFIYGLFNNNVSRSPICHSTLRWDCE